MQITKIFKSGNSQAVRIPKDYQIDAKEVYIEKRKIQLLLDQKRMKL